MAKFLLTPVRTQKLDLLSAGRDKIISRSSRWPEGGRERMLMPVLRTAEVNEVLSLEFSRPLIPASSLFLIKQGVQTTQRV